MDEQKVECMDGVMTDNGRNARLIFRHASSSH